MKAGVEHVEALILRVRDYGEADRIIQLFTRSRGRLSAFAPSARKSVRRFGGSLDLFSLVRATLTPPRRSGQGLWRLAQVELLNPFLPLRQDLERLAIGAYWAECLTALIGEEDPQEVLFQWFQSALEMLATTENPMDHVPHMDLELLALCGYAPRWSSCLQCGAEVSGPRIFFSFSHGGAVCSACRRDGKGRWLEKDLARKLAQKNRIPLEHRMYARRVVSDFITHTLGRELRSDRFREEVFRGHN